MNGQVGGLRAKKFGFVRKVKVSHYKDYNHRG